MTRMEPLRAYYEYPPSHANMPARDYGGSVSVGKAKRSWGDFLKFRSRNKERNLPLSPVSGSHILPPHSNQPTISTQTTHNYLAEYRQKYGAYNGTVSRTSFQALTVVNNISPPPAMAPNNKAKEYSSHTSVRNGYASHVTTGTVSASTGATMASTVRYTDWFGSVVGRRAPVRPPLPAFTAVPSAGTHQHADKNGAWDHYVTLDPVYEAPHVVPVQLYTNVCVCPDQLLNTRGRKKKKCKRCGRKVATVRHTTTGGAAKVRPALPASMYQPLPPQPVAPAPAAWGWQVLEEHLYEKYEVAGSSHSRSPIRTQTDEDESPPPTPETVRSVKSIRSARSGKSSDSSATITREMPEPSRKAATPPTITRALPPPPRDPESPSHSTSAKESTDSSQSPQRNSILLDKSSAYNMISRYGQSNTHIGSDTDELSDNAVDSWEMEASHGLNNTSQKAPERQQVNVISIGSETSNSDAKASKSSLCNGWESNNKIKIYTDSSQPIYTSGGTSLKINTSMVRGDSRTIVTADGTQSSVDTEYQPNSSNNKSSLSTTTSSFSSNLNHRKSSSPKLKSTSSHEDIASSKCSTSSSTALSASSPSSSSSYSKGIKSSGRTALSKEKDNLSRNKRTSAAKKNVSMNYQNTYDPPFNSQEDLQGSVNTSLRNKSASSSTKSAQNSNKKSGMSFNVVDNNMSKGSSRVEVKELRDPGELRRGGNSVRIAGQRMLVLTPGAPPPDTNSGFSTDEENDEATVEDDTSDYPLSSPTTTRGSDSDTLPEEEDLPYDSSNLTYKPVSTRRDYRQPDSQNSGFDSPTTHGERWKPARDTIYEEEEDEVEINGRNNSQANEDDDEGDDADKDDPSISSSSTSSPMRHEGLHPTLSELLKVKSILKKPASVDTSSETDSDFYLPTFSEFKQNQRKKKQVQFRSCHDVTVIEDAGESKGRKLSSVRSTKKDRDKARERQKSNNYNLISDLQDIYARGNLSNLYRTRLKNEFNENNLINEEDKNCEKDEFSETSFSNGGGETILQLEGDVQQIGDSGGEVKEDSRDPQEEFGYPVDFASGDSWRNRSHLDSSSEYRAEVYKPGSSSLSHSVSDNHTDVNSSYFQDSTQNTKPIKATLNHSSKPGTIVPTRQAPPPPRNRTISPTRPSVPPPPPPTSRSAPVNLTPVQRPLPSPPALPPESPPPLPLHSPPPSPPPPPLPTSPPPMLDAKDQMVIISQGPLSPVLPQNSSFSSFLANSDSGLPSSVFSPPVPVSSQEAVSEQQPQRIREILPPLGSVSVFGVGGDDETRTATIRGRGAAHSRPSIMQTFTPNPPDNSSSSPPVAPHRRNRNRSLSPETSNHRARSNSNLGGGRGRRSSFLNGLVGDENPYEQIKDHIYEELRSAHHSPSRTSTFSNHSASPTHSCSTRTSPSPGKSMFEGASKHEILEYLQDARQRVAITADEEEEVKLQGLEGPSLGGEVDLEDEEDDQLGVDPPEDNFAVLASRNRGNRSSNMSSNSDSSENSGLLRTDKERLVTAEVERTDSGVGSETSKPFGGIRRSHPTLNGISAAREGDIPLCDDCDASVDTHVTNSGVVYAPLVCRRCSRRRQERKEILTEIMETEIKYGRDLRVMVDEFYRPILVAGLLTREQLSGIFLNVEELVEHNRMFTLQLRDAFEIALDQGDEDLLTVNVAKLFLNAAPMLHAFENYCVRQGSASLLLQSLEKEKELLRIFLKVSQMENTLLRRMNLHSFLMVPVQRVTKYPLLLARLYKTTPPTHSSREDCRRAKEKIELHLQHMNNETKEVSPTKLWRRISMSVGSGVALKRSPQPHDSTTNLKLRKLALEILDWSLEEARVVREGRLFCLAPDFNNWTRRGRSLKMASVHVLLVTLGTPRAVFEEEVPEDGLVTPRDLGIKDAAMLAFKDYKVSKAALVRQEPWLLSRCVVAWEAEGETECFEVTDLSSKETYIFKGSDSTSTEAWFRYIQFHALSVGIWKRRRPALANIMINGMTRS